MHLTPQFRIWQSRAAVMTRASLVLLPVLIATSPFAWAQEENLGETSRPPASESSPQSDSTSETDRRVQRLGDVVGENEWQLELTVPQPAGALATDARLPDPAQQQQLQTYLAELADQPGNASVQRRLQQLLDSVMADASAALARGDAALARPMVEVVAAVDPNHPQLPEARAGLERLGLVEGQLEAARLAMQEGRIDQPEDRSAWFYYRQVLDQAPENAEARLGLEQVRDHLLEQALDHAKRNDFDSAERSLEDASFVLQDQAAIESTRKRLADMRVTQAEQLEARAVKAMDAGDFATAERLLIDLIAVGGQDSRVNQLRRRLEEARVYGGFQPGQILRDHFITASTWAPETVVVLAGSYMMGSLEEETGRTEYEGPQHRVVFRRGFAMGQREVSVSDFRDFVQKAGYRTDAEREGHSIVYDPYSGRLIEKEGINWQKDYEGNPADSDLPVVHVSWNDAQAYVDWLARGTGKSYRLPSEAEFEYAARGGTNTRFWWGNGSPSSLVENLTGDGDTSRGRRRWTVAFDDYSDKHWGPAPVKSFAANPFGLYDMSGNVGEWVRDCWHDSYVRAPTDGSAWINPGCEERVIRGGYWASSPDKTRSAHRLYANAKYRDARTGFRVVRDL